MVKGTIIVSVSESYRIWNILNITSYQHKWLILELQYMLSHFFKKNTSEQFHNQSYPMGNV